MFHVILPQPCMGCDGNGTIGDERVACYACGALGYQNTMGINLTARAALALLQRLPPAEVLAAEIVRETMEAQQRAQETMARRLESATEQALVAAERLERAAKQDPSGG